MKKPSERIAELIRERHEPGDNHAPIAIGVIIRYLDEQAAPKLRFCPECQKEGSRSTVRMVDSVSYAVDVSGWRHWDEDGVFHDGGRQPGYDVFECSNGHGWREDRR